MDFLSSVGSFFSNLINTAYCYFNPSDSSCAPAPREASVDRFEPIRPIEARRLEDLVRESRPVQVGCYIQMHRVREFHPEQISNSVRNGRP